jgi:DNA-binding transcriptional MocR family regulator
MKFEFTRALLRANKHWGKRDRSGNYLAVALAVYNYSSADGTSSYASAERVSKDAGISKRTVERALQFLRAEGLIHLDRRGGRSGDGSTWASEYSLRIPDKWSDATELKKRASLESRSATSTYQSATTRSQPATTARQPAAYVADHQIRYITSDSSDSNATNPAPDLPEAEEWVADDPVTCTGAGNDVRSIGDASEPDWDAMKMALADLPEPSW